MEFEYNNPVKIVFGRKKREETGKLVKEIGEKPLIVTGKNSMKKHGFLQQIQRSLRKEGIKPETFLGIEPNPSTLEIDTAAEKVKEKKCDFLIGLGGGSSMDASKAIAVASKEGTPFWRFSPTGEGDLDKSKALPIVCIPSTSGTGSEVNQYSVISNPETGEKPGLGASSMYPETAIIDPKIPSKMPPNLTATTGVDVFVHALEALVSTKSNPLSDSYSIKALKLLKENLINAYKNPNRSSRKKMAAASTLGGLAISSAGTGLIHGLEHPLSGKYPEIAHADGLAALTLPVIKYNYNSNKERYIEISKIISGQKDIFKAVKKLFSSLNMPNSLKGLGITESEVEELVNSALITMADTFETNPREADRKDAEKIMKNALE